MNTVHDMGGMHGFGRIPREDEQDFHAEWEKRLTAIVALSAFNGLALFDECRRATESMPAADYLATPYFGRWLHMMEALLLEKGVATPDEIRAGRRAAGGSVWPGARLPADQVWPAFHGGGVARAEVSDPPRFRIGDVVTAKEMNPAGHTRLPRYARGKRGVIHLHHGGFVFADTRAHGLGDSPQHVYNVRFDARELWGEAASAGDALYLDLWESYLQ